VVPRARDRLTAVTDAEYAAAARLNLARQMAPQGGWLTADYVDMRDNAAARDAMLADGHIVRQDRGRIRAYEITDAGRAWLATQEG
jgi:hypothetical protein